MTVSADKLQFILQSTLQESISLVKRGIFSQQQLKQIMSKRQKLQKGMLKMEYQITDYLAAIEYQYQLQRLRRFRMDQITKIENGNINPSFKKQSSSDFAIIKRIIRLWDRTMHKYKFKLHIWKQYLQFCIVLGSKKHFYKALTKSLRFLPFQVDLWKIGVQYQKQHGHNYWKARKILLKGLKMIPCGARNIQLGKYMISFQLQFIKALQKRNNIISKTQQGMNFINPDGKIQQDQQQLDFQQDQQNQGDQQQDFDNTDKKLLSSINLNEYDEVIWLVIQQIIKKNTNNNQQSFHQHKIVNQIYQLLNILYIDNKESFIRQMITKIKTKLNQYSNQQNHFQLKIEVQDNNQPKIIKIQPQNNQFQSIIQDNKINFKIAEQFIKKYCLKIEQSQKLFQFLGDYDYIGLVLYLNKARFMIKLPNNALAQFISKYIEKNHELRDQKQIIKRYLINQIDKKIEASDYRKNGGLLKYVLKFNSIQNRYESTTKIMRSLSINYKKQPQFLEKCNKICNSFNQY